MLFDSFFIRHVLKTLVKREIRFLIGKIIVELIAYVFIFTVVFRQLVK
jgi:hypothetical protein